MILRYSSWGLLVVLIGSFGCSKNNEPPKELQPAQYAYFKTHWQDESQFIVEETLTDIAEMAFYAKSHKLPEPNTFWVVATEKQNQFRHPVYEIKISLAKNKAVPQFDLAVNESIWSPAVYADATKRIFDALNLQSAGSYLDRDEGTVMDELLDAKATTLEQQNKAVSDRLQLDFSNPKLHEQAALIVACFAMREWSGHFFDVRLPLTRATAHLAMATALAGVPQREPSGVLAEALVNVCTGNERAAGDKVHKLRDSEKTQLMWMRAVDAARTGDYRAIEQLKDPSGQERIAWFAAYCDSVDVNAAWQKLKREDMEYADFPRIASCYKYSVEIGHGLLQHTLPMEYKEMAEVYELSQGKKLDKDYIAELNRMPERCFTLDKNGKPVVRVIGWGQWAMFFQRQVCNAVSSGYHFLRNSYGDADSAHQFSTNALARMKGLRLYPFVQRFVCEDQQTYHQSVDDGFALTVATPHLVSPEVWNYLCWPVNFAPQYSPNPNPHVNEWHKHNPPPGTVYNLGPRLHHPSLVDRADAATVFEELHQLAPSAIAVCDKLIQLKYNNRPTAQQLEEVFGSVIDYSPHAMGWCASASTNDPARYEQLMSKAATLEPTYYRTLSAYFENKDDAKAAAYGEKAFELDPDKVRVSNSSRWLVSYYLKKGNTKRAKEIAEFCGEVYSSRGLSTLADFYEVTSNYTKAFETYQALEERYNQSSDLIRFVTRYKKGTGDNRYDDEIKKRVKKIFPRGIEKVTLKDFNGPPTEGVLINEDNDLLKQAGLSKGDIIVATYGMRMHNMLQYVYARESRPDVMELVVWKKDHYENVQADPPEHMFNADFRDYRVRKPKN